MKINLNSYILQSSEYLEFLRYRFEDFNKSFPEENIIAPYFYTLSLVSEKECKYFKIFYMNYLTKADIDFSWNDDYEDQISKDPVLWITFIIAVQYYFL